MLTSVLLVLGGVMLGAAYFVVSHRRRTPYLQLDIDRLPALDEGLSTLAGLTRGTVSLGNRFRIFQNGALYPAMEQDILAAKHSVHLETFVWSAGTLEQRFVELLLHKAQHGVRVRLLIDAMGGWKADKHRLESLRRGGVEVAVYCRPKWWNLRRFNHRTHRKLLVVDGSIGFVFGHGIADQWLGEGQDKDHWRDTAVRCEGPVVLALQSIFMENWIEEARCVPAGEGCFPSVDAIEGGSAAHVVASASGEALSAVALLYTVAIACAQREVIIQNPYFVPDDGVCELLGTMVKRGVQVSLMVPGGNTDSPFVRRAGCYLYASLLEAGVQLYEFEPTLLHQKIVIVDEVWSHIGSTNFDARSLALNEEAGIGILDAAVARELKAAFVADLRRSKRLSLDEWRRRPLRSRAFDWFAYQIHDQL